MVSIVLDLVLIVLGMVGLIMEVLGMFIIPFSSGMGFITGLILTVLIGVTEGMQ